MREICVDPGKDAIIQAANLPVVEDLIYLPCRIVIGGGGGEGKRAPVEAPSEVGGD